MPIKKQLSDNLKNCARSMECPPEIHERIQNSYNNYLEKKERGNLIMKKRLIASIAAVAIVLPIGVFAGPKLIETARTHIIQEKDVNLAVTDVGSKELSADKIKKESLEKIYNAFPETKTFDITSIKSGKGYVGSQQMNWTSFELQENGENGRIFSFGIDSSTGEFSDIHMFNWNENFGALNDKEITEKGEEMITKIFGSLKGYKSEVKTENIPKEKLENIPEEERNKATKYIKYVQFENPDKDVYFKVYYKNSDIGISALLK